MHILPVPVNFECLIMCNGLSHHGRVAQRKLFPGSEFMRQGSVNITKHKDNTHSLELHKSQLPAQ